MPTPGTHLIAAMVAVKRYGVGDKQAFVTGAIWPDIRYLGVITRDATHKECFTEDDIRTETDDWMRGRLHHNWLDDRWNEVFAELSYTESTGLKCYADILLRPLLDEAGWRSLRAALKEICASELTCGIAEEDLRRWHDKFLPFTIEPESDDDLRQVFIEFGLDAGKVDRILAARDRYLHDEVMQARLTDFVNSYISRANDV